MHPFTRSRLAATALAASLLTPLAGCAGDGATTHVNETRAGADAGANAAADDGAVTFERLTSPDRTVVRSGDHVVASFTDGARTAVIAGEERTFEEPEATDATVTTSSWVRLLPKSWYDGAESDEWFTTWFDKARKDTSPDVFALAFQYVEGAEDLRKDGVRIAGDASFGPVRKVGKGRLEANDFPDYLGVRWRFADGTKDPDPRRYGSLDCSGFLRMVLGYRLGFPVNLGNAPSTTALPRRAFAIAKGGPGVVVVPNTGRKATAYDALQPGDLVFFEVEGGTDELDHVGLYLGVDSDDKHRFISSREMANGPTMGDIGSASTLEGATLYPQGWRTARRI